MTPVQHTSADESLLGAVDGNNSEYALAPYQRTLTYSGYGQTSGSLLFLNGLLLDEVDDGYSSAPGLFATLSVLVDTDTLTARLFSSAAPTKYRRVDSTLQGAGLSYRIVANNNPTAGAQKDILLFRNGVLLTYGLDYVVFGLFWITLNSTDALVDGDSLIAVSSISGISCSTWDGSITGALDGSNVYFQMPVEFEDIMLFRNGLLLTKDLDYELAGYGQVLMLQAPQPGDVVSARIFLSDSPGQVTTFDGSLSYLQPDDSWLFRNGLLLTPPIDYVVSQPTPFIPAVSQRFHLAGAGTPLLFRNGVLQLPGANYFLNGDQFSMVPELATAEVLAAWMYPATVPAPFASPVALLGTCNSANDTFTLPWDVVQVNIFRNGIMLIAGNDYIQHGRLIVVDPSQIPGPGELMIAVAGIGGIQISSTAGTITGDIDGVNQTFFLSAGVISALMLFRSGALLIDGSDFVRDGNTITLAPEQIPAAGETLSAQIFASEPPSQLTTEPVFSSATEFLFSQPVTNPLVFRAGILQYPGDDYDLSTAGILVQPALGLFELLTALTFPFNGPSRFDTPVSLRGAVNGENLTFLIPHWIVDAGIRFDVFQNGIYLNPDNYSRAGYLLNLIPDQVPALGETISLVVGLGGIQLSSTAGSIIGAIDGVNTIFSLRIAAQNVVLFLNGILMTSGTDYLFSSGDIIFESQIPQPGWVISAIGYSSGGPSQQSTGDGSITAIAPGLGIRNSGQPQHNAEPIGYDIASAQLPQTDDVITVETWTPDITDGPAFNLGTRYTTVNGTLSGTIDGINNVFTINVPLLGSGVLPPIVQALVWWNGVLLTPGVDYLLNGNQIVMATPSAPTGADILTAEVYTQ